MRPWGIVSYFALCLPVVFGVGRFRRRAYQIFYWSQSVLTPDHLLIVQSDRRCGFPRLWRRACAAAVSSVRALFSYALTYAGTSSRSASRW